MRYVLAIAALIAGVTVGEELPKDTIEKKTLQVEQAEPLTHPEDVLYLDNRLTTLSDDAANALRAKPHIRLPDQFRQ